MAKKKGKKNKKSRKANKKAAKAAKKARKAAKRGKTTHKAPKLRKAKRAKKVKAVKKATAARKASRPALKARQQPESLRLRSAGPSYTVSDIQRSLAFYRDVLGFTQGELWEEAGQLKGVELVAGNVRFWLGQDDWLKGRDRVKGLGFRIYCATSQDIDMLAARVRAGGGELAEGPRDQSWGGRAFAVRDPDGFTITFSSDL